MQNLNLVDTSTLGPKNKFTKVRLLIEKLDKQCFLLYLLEQAISTDESIVPQFGRHGCLQFMRNKPVKFGLSLESLLSH